MDNALALVTDDEVGVVVLVVREVAAGELVDVVTGARVDLERLVVVVGLPELVGV